MNGCWGVLALSDQVEKTMKKHERFVNEEELTQSNWGDLSIDIQVILNPNTKFVAQELAELYSDK